MSFKWSNIELQWDPVSFRYINDMIWYHYQILGMIPINLFCIIRIYYHIFDRKRHWNIHIEEKSAIFLLFLTLWAPVYYFNDAIISFWEDTHFTECRFPYFFHHIIAVTVQPILLSRKYLNWWDLIVCGLHAILMAFPHSQFATYSYVISIFTFNICLLVNSNCWQNRLVGKMFPFIYYSFFLILISEDCDSSLPYLAE